MSVSPDLSTVHTADVIVVGAGMAGVGAARDLRLAGRSVIVLEARDRLGGRLHTIRPGWNAPLELGASWIHGAEGNPLSELARSLGLATTLTNPLSLAIHEADGRLLSPDERQATLIHAFSLLGQLIGLKDEKQRDGASDLSLQRALEQILAAAPISPEEHRRIEFEMAVAVEVPAASDLADLSLFNWDQAEQRTGLTDAVLPGGYDQILEFLSHELDVRLEHVVHAIEYGGDSVTVFTTHGPFQAPRVIVTLPLGVLKQGAVTFTPPLPDRKVEALQRLGMGMLNKLFLLFPEVFWDETDFIGYVGTRRSKWPIWFNVHRSTDAPILTGLIAGEVARATEDLSDSAVMDDAMSVLRIMFGSSVPEPLGMIRSRWGSDPYALGSYSHLPPGAVPSDHAILAEPIADRLYFAGEATSERYPGTVHGAWLSGRREAARILGGALGSR